MNYIAQLFGLLGLFLMAKSYKNTEKYKFLFCQIFANLSYALQYLVLFAFPGMITTFISIVRTIVYYNYESNNKETPASFLFLFIVLMMICGVLTYANILSIIPIIIGIIYAYGTWQRKIKITYIIGIIVSVLWLYYNFKVGAYIASLGSIFELSAATLGLINLSKKKGAV